MRTLFSVVLSSALLLPANLLRGDIAASQAVQQSIGYQAYDDKTLAAVSAYFYAVQVGLSALTASQVLTNAAGYLALDDKSLRAITAWGAANSTSGTATSTNFYGTNIIEFGTHTVIVGRVDPESVSLLPTSYYSVGIGSPNNLSYSNSVAIGAGTCIAADNGVAVGYNSTANGIGAIAIGANTDANYDYEIAIGRDAGQGGQFTNTIEIGYQASATKDNQAVIGSLSKPTTETLLRGTTKISYSLNGAQAPATNFSGFVITSNSLAQLTPIVSAMPPGSTFRWSSNGTVIYDIIKDPAGVLSTNPAASGSGTFSTFVATSTGLTTAGNGTSTATLSSFGVVVTQLFSAPLTFASSLFGTNTAAASSGVWWMTNGTKTALWYLGTNWPGNGKGTDVANGFIGGSNVVQIDVLGGGIAFCIDSNFNTYIGGQLFVRAGTSTTLSNLINNGWFTNAGNFTNTGSVRVDGNISGAASNYWNFAVVGGESVPTNILTSSIVDFAKAEQTFQTNNVVNILGFTGKDATGKMTGSTLLKLTNSAGLGAAFQTNTVFPANVHVVGNTVITNWAEWWIEFVQPTGPTNAWSLGGW